MTNLAVKIPVLEYEAGWGNKVDDFMVCTSIEDAQKFKMEFNAKNKEQKTPDWYMVAQDEPVPVSLNTQQMRYLMQHKRVWWSCLKKL